MANKLIVEQKKSSIGCSPIQRKTLVALGLRGINAKREHADTPVIRGMISKVHHLIDVKEV